MQGETLPVPAEDAGQETLTPEGWKVLREQAMVLVKTHFLPKGVDTPEKAIAIMLKGRELGIPPMYALSNIAVINGTSTAGAELMLALIYRDHGDDAIRVAASTPARCTVAYRRRGWPQHEAFSFTIEGAQRAGLLGKDNWQHYPAAMRGHAASRRWRAWPFPIPSAGSTRRRKWERALHSSQMKRRSSTAR